MFQFAQESLQLRNGTIKATVLIAPLPAVFDMHEIQYELRDHIVGLNCGRWGLLWVHQDAAREAGVCVAGSERRPS